MKRLLLTLTAALLATTGFNLSAQEATTQEAPAPEEVKEEKEMKTGWSFGILPTATYSVDNGFQAGAFGDVYYYGDGGTYPDPLHKISWEASYFTKSQRQRYYLAYDSKYLVPGMRINASLTYVRDPLYSFWGFNGPASVQDYDIWSNRYTTPNINYYGMSRNMFRALANVQGRVTDHLNWAAGINFWNWELGDMRDNGVAMDGKNPNNISYYDKSLTLYKRYQDLGAIKAEEAAGGMSVEVNAGFVYDTRDMEAAPNRGIWAEAYLNGAPYSGNPKTGLYSPYLKACVYFRHYISIPIPIPAGNPVFAYRLAWQQTIAGETPLYMIQNIPLLVQRNMISEGFGSSNTIRGVRENRILAEGLAWANTELRVKLVNFKLFNQYFYLAVNPFFDAGIITKPYRDNILNAVTYDPALTDPDLYTSYTDYLKGDLQMSIHKSGILKGEYKQKTIKQINSDVATLKNFDQVHGSDYDGKIYDPSHVRDIIMSAGGGLKLAMNQNFIISAELAKCFTPGLDAGLWIGIGINYQF